MPHPLNREFRFVCRSVLRFVDRFFFTAMGCFFACFRAADDRRRPHLVSDSVQPIPSRKRDGTFAEKEAVVSNNRLSSLLLSQEGDDYEQSNSKSRCVGSTEINEELVKEAKFLKACGTIPETPAEIRGASRKLNGSPPLNDEIESSGFHSGLSNASIQKLHLDDQIHDSPIPIKIYEECGHDSPSELTPISCISNEPSTGSRSLSVVDDATSLPVKNKSVRFDSNIDTSSSKGSSENVFSVFQRSDAHCNSITSKPNPKPTPLKLSDEMQTPGTVFPLSVEVLGKGKTRIRSQYVHPVLNPIENAAQWKEQQQDNSTAHELPVRLKVNSDQLENASPDAAGGVKDASLQNMNVEASLSSWLKPKQYVQDGDPIDGTSASKNFLVGGTPMDRPIIGMVAAHWNKHEAANISPKWWDGNGIPNSTHKYKEDQKVSWHATPFEVRLEKALSEETSISQKIPMDGGTILFDGQNENDLVLSKLQPPTKSKPVASC